MKLSEQIGKIIGWLYKDIFESEDSIKFKKTPVIRMEKDELPPPAGGGIKIG